MDGVIKELGKGGTLFFAKPRKRTRACILTKGMGTTFVPQLSGADLATAKLRDLVIMVESIHMPYGH